MDEQTIIYLGATIAMVVLVIANASSFGIFGALAVALAIVTAMIIVILNYADFVLFPVFTSMFGIKITPAKGYYIPKSSNSVVKYVNGLYYATGYLSANVYSYVFTAESIDESEEQKLGEAPDKWERIVMNAGFPFRFNIISMAEDVQRYRDELQGMRGTFEFRLSKEESSSSPSQLTIDDLNKKMSIIDARINRLSSGERPVDAVMYIESTAVGVSEKDAEDALTNQLNHLQTLFNSFDLSITRVMGREVYHLFTFNYSLPEHEYLLQTFTLQK
ncbi:MAG: hypothetical protein KGH57_00585 [Candidatus Micrarchaeota archaeon]|nr:hypothetical protein [Candidatus Micrarchaeota archaeon]